MNTWVNVLTNSSPKSSIAHRFHLVNRAWGKTGLKLTIVYYNIGCDEYKHYPTSHPNIPCIH